MTDQPNSPLLKIEDLSVSFRTDEGEVEALDQVSLDVQHGQTVGVVGESGCGKSVTAAFHKSLIYNCSAFENMLV